MYFTAFDALEPADLEFLKCILEDVRVQRNIAINDPATRPLAQEIIELWMAGFRNPDEMRAMMTPDFFKA